MPILKAEEFVDLFYRYCNDERTYNEAYEMAEDEHVSKFGERRYSSYNSFYQTIRRICK